MSNVCINCGHPAEFEDITGKVCHYRTEIKYGSPVPVYTKSCRSCMDRHMKCVKPEIAIVAGVLR